MIESVALAVKHGITGLVLNSRRTRLVIVFSTFFTLKSFVLSCVMEETVFHR